MPSNATLKKRAIEAREQLTDTVYSTTDLQKVAVSAGKLVTAVARLASR